MENIILVEYFTSKSKLKIEFEKNLISEALKICDSISLNFTSTSWEDKCKEEFDAYKRAVD